MNNPVEKSFAHIQDTVKKRMKCNSNYICNHSRIYTRRDYTHCYRMCKLKIN